MMHCVMLLPSIASPSGRRDSGTGPVSLKGKRCKESFLASDRRLQEPKGTTKYDRSLCFVKGPETLRFAASKAVFGKP